MKKRRKNFTNRKKRFLILNTFLVLFLVLGIGYSALSSNLNIFGDITLKKPIPPGIVFEIVPTNSPENGDKFVYGEGITFSVKVTNNYPYEITDATISDELSGNEFPDITIDPYDSYSFTMDEYYVSEADIVEGKIHFYVYLNGYDQDGNVINEEYDYSFTEIEEPNPDVEISINYDKTRTYNLDDEINYSISVKNIGNVTLTSGEIHDEFGLANFTAESMSPSTTISGVGHYTVTETDIINGQLELNASFTATDPEDNIIEKNWSGIIPLESSKPKVDLTYDVEQINNIYVFNFKIKNTGNVSVSTGALTVSNASTDDISWDIIGLAPSGELNYQYTYNTLDNPGSSCHVFDVLGSFTAITGDESNISQQIVLGDCQ